MRCIRLFMLLGLMIVGGAAPALAAYDASLKQVEDALQTALAADGVKEEIELFLTGRYGDTVFRSAAPYRIEVRGLERTAADHFSARVHFVDAASSATAPQVMGILPVEGRYERYVRVPVLAHRMRREDVIAPNDISWQRVSVRKLRGDTVMTAAELIGKSPERGLSTNRPISRDELASPLVVRKGDLVTMVVRAPKMTLSTLGVALDAAGIGETLALRNTDTNVQVQGVVTEPGVVQVIMNAGSV